MKRMFLLSIFVPLALMAADYPGAPSSGGYIVDQAGIISPAYQQEIASICSELEQSKAVRMQVLTLESTGDDNIDDYAEQVRQSWSGDSAGSKNLLLVVAKQDHKIATSSGSEVKAILKESTIDRVRRDILLPNFREEKYGRGIMWGLRVYAQEIEGKSTVEVENESVDKNVEGQEISEGDDAACTACMQAACLFSFFMWWNDLWDHDHQHHHHHRNRWDH